ncbi:indolepyruvate ferredoxin oxidoreductase family protein [Tropicimonas sp. IMCC34043]|uniref:indolepyruvate ferredoxin oxidoreductase family protein n=1 Tax=Tropicimonas sp. IMCC34043 TaxID=2248760 RepID=UPI000E23BD4C|nr:indolepyruvate ferredoxin oxidoreductase family protein [Tropicimonas sp. IMCC34043]
MQDVTLEDKYALKRGRVFVTGSQALARLPMLQRDRDVLAGLNTAGFISGYRGSPLGGYDMALWKAAAHLEAAHVRFQPGLNEDLAATAVWGTQQVGMGGRSQYDGVFAIWYGKGPGVDRSGDVFKHGNMAGTAPHGGVLALFGDDPMAKSSTVPHQSEPALIAAGMPVFDPASIQEYLDFGLMAFALSRFSGLWTGMKCITDIVEGSASVTIDPLAAAFVTPGDFVLPEGGVHIRPHEWGVGPERRLVEVKLPAALAFVRANGWNRATHLAPRRRIGVIAAGKSWADLMAALEDLGLDAKGLDALGISVWKPAVTWPLEPEGLRAFAAGHETLLVIEEKRPLIEDQVARILYDLPDRPQILGKADAAGRPLLPGFGELTERVIARTLARLLVADAPEGLRPQLDRALQAAPAPAAAAARRTPWFCAGCPHNSSTLVPEGSRAFAGIGCHTMALFMPNRHTEGFTQMGGEGAQWIGQAAFSKDRHVFQNLGDGTYCHSGSLAIRAAVAAGVNITYKILFNDAVAMTGGQPVDAPLTPWGITRQVAAEGVARIVVVTDRPENYPPGTPWAEGVTIHHRREIDAVQRDLREVPGVTVLLYDQTCAAEKRRRRKRGTYPDPAERIFINPAVCEGCGDCGIKSNCVAIRPLETAFGRKRQIDQSSCNKDFSCVAGFCPSFVTVHGAEPRKPAPRAGDDLAGLLAAMPDPDLPALGAGFNILVTGIGGTGVVTVGALLGMAAHLSGLGASVLDQTGLAQKNGAVTSHVRIGPDPAALHGTRIPAGHVDLVIGCDMVVAAGAEAMALLSPGRTRVVLNDRVTPLASFALDPDEFQDGPAIVAALGAALHPAAVATVASDRLARTLLGDAIFANPFLLGFAWQKGLIPLGRAELEQAIRLNGTAVARNLAAFGWGRVAAQDPDRVAALADQGGAEQLPMTLDALIDHRVAHLTGYQDPKLARRYCDRVDRVRALEARLLPGQEELSRAVAWNYAKLLAFKDEYEVARLYADPAFATALAERFETPERLSFHLAPPILARIDPATGEPVKRVFGPWILRLFRLLAGLRGLRGTPFDPFGYTAERRQERQLIRDYESWLEALEAGLTPQTAADWLALLSLPERIRGFGPVKARALTALAPERQALTVRLGLAQA